MRGSRSGVPESVDEYLAKVSPDKRETLQKLRKTIRAAAPNAQEVISYGIPAFRYHGNLVYYAAFRDHCSFFVGSLATQRKFAAELKRFAAGKGTVHFTPERPLPPALVTRIVKARVAENEARAKPRAGKGPSKKSR